MGDAMAGLSSAAMLDAWEVGAQVAPIARGSVLLAVSGQAQQSWSQRPPVGGQGDHGYSVGRADALLLTLRGATFGPTLAAVTDCPRCREALEFDTTVADLLLSPRDGSLEDTLWSGADTVVRYRLPTHADLQAVADLPDEQTAAAALFAACVLSAEAEGRPVRADELPPEVVEAVSADMGVHDPQAELTLAFSCPACSHTWVASFDIGDYLWNEVAAQARTLLAEIHVLAGAYGWCEGDILSLSPARRRAYLELVRG